MKDWSLRARLLLLAFLTTLGLLIVAGFGFNQLFKMSVERYAAAELDRHSDQLLAALEFDENGALGLTRELSDPRFSQPDGGVYWQIDAKDAEPLRSRSLWDEALSLSEQLPENQPFTLTRADGRGLLVRLQTISLEKQDGSSVSLRIALAQDRETLGEAMVATGRAMATGLALLGLALLASSALIIVLGLRPLAQLQGFVSAKRQGQNSSAVALPVEVRPLTDEINALLSARERQLERARQRAGNMAHGLKTPLSVLAAVAEELAGKGEQDAAHTISGTVGQMRDLVDRELARSRMAASSASHRSKLAENVSRITETMKRAPNASHLTFTNEIGEATEVAMDRIDLLELLGNLIDNARKHARSQVVVRHDSQTLSVEDDGPGVPPDKLKTISMRGVKLDERAAGSGLGLAIVSGLAEAYDLGLTLDTSPLGGLRVSVTLPAIA